MESEVELERGHVDLTMSPDMRQYQVLDILIEFTFVSL